MESTKDIQNFKTEKSAIAFKTIQCFPSSFKVTPQVLGNYSWKWASKSKLRNFPCWASKVVRHMGWVSWLHNGHSCVTKITPNYFFLNKNTKYFNTHIRR